MKKRIIYNETEIIDILENDNSITYFPSNINVMTAEIKTARRALLSIGVNCDRINQELGETPPPIINYIETPISPDPNDADTSRTAQFWALVDHAGSSIGEVHYLIKHFDTENNHKPEKDRIAVIPARYDLPYMDTGLSRYEFFTKLVKGQITGTPVPVYTAAELQIQTIDQFGEFDNPVT
jgi:hypothetical protein